MAVAAKEAQRQVRRLPPSATVAGGCSATDATTAALLRDVLTVLVLDASAWYDTPEHVCEVRRPRVNANCSSEPEPISR